MSEETEILKLEKELPKIGEDVVSAREDMSEETYNKLIDAMVPKEGSMADMAALYDTQERISIDIKALLGYHDEDFSKLPLAKSMDFDDVFASVQNDFASLLAMQEAPESNEEGSYNNSDE
jgi:hypothetical protein